MFLLRISLSVRRIPMPKLLMQMVFTITNLQCRIQHNGHLEFVLALTICRAVCNFLTPLMLVYEEYKIQGCVGTVCPCFLFGKNAEFLGSGTLAGSCMTHCILWGLVNSLCCLFTGGLLAGVPGSMVACYACGYRKTLRAKYNLQVGRKHRAATCRRICSAICAPFAKSTERFARGRMAPALLWHSRLLLLLQLRLWRTMGGDAVECKIDAFECKTQANFILHDGF